jgi:hypothetical protein
MDRRKTPGKKSLHSIGEVLRNFRLGVMLVLRQLTKIARYLKQKILFVVAIILLLIFISLILALTVPTPDTFEGHLMVKDLSFTYEGEKQDQLFLNDIREIKQISVNGKQKLLHLTGKFESKFYSKLNQLNSLTIELPNEDSQWNIASVTPESPGQIELVELQLQPNTKVEYLTYNSYKIKKQKINRLSLSLVQETNKRPNSLQLYLGDRPLKVSLENYRIPQLNLQTKSDNPNSRELEFTFIPDIKELNLQLDQRTNLLIDLPEAMPDDSNQWFWGGSLKVRNVEFQHLEQPTGVDVSDAFYNSTILKGTIRMAKQELKIERNQFLIVKEPGKIERLRNIQLTSPQQTPGLEVRIIGTTQLIQVGLDPKFPVASIQVNPIEKFISPEVSSTVLGFCFTTVGTLLGWLFAQAPKPSKKSDTSE